MSLDLDLAALMNAELDAIIKDSVESLTSGLSYDKYQQACGYIEAMRQMRNGVIPKILDELQRR